MKLSKKHKLILAAPALWAAFFDCAITIYYQPAEYWNGSLTKANEANPIGHFMMNWHQGGIFLLSISWRWL